MEGRVAILEKGGETLDFTSAVDVLNKEYTERDGIDIKTLVDSKVNGGLTYNDFLILSPIHI